MLKSSSLCLYSSNLDTFWWSSFKIVSVSAVLYPRWPPLIKIEISSNGQNCSILSQKVSKFELYKHNDELFNIYYGIFLWTLNFYRFWPIMQIRKKRGCNKEKIFSETIEPISTKLCISAKFGWDWLSSFRGEHFLKISSPLFSNLHNRSKWVMGFTSKLQGR
jgi:hypothetical protein